uniref:Uncharacterized protein n=1 Tax=Rhizophora mucronata TaxID=61149 RepID=A0A2P2PEK5_RHIMU
MSLNAVRNALRYPYDMGKSVTSSRMQ